MRIKADILKEIRMVLVGDYYGYSLEKAVETTIDYPNQTQEALLHILRQMKARLPRLKLSDKTIEIPIVVDTEDTKAIRHLENEISNYLVRIQQIVDSTHYETEADRFADIASNAEAIGTAINECKAINWDEVGHECREKSII
jgi:hypothetical protein